MQTVHVFGLCYEHKVNDVQTNIKWSNIIVKVFLDQTGCADIFFLVYEAVFHSKKETKLYRMLKLLNRSTPKSNSNC